MTPELQKYYEARFSMFATEGWQDLMTDIAEMIKATDRIGGVANLESLKFKQGELSILHWLSGLHELTNKVYEDLKNESDD